MISLARLPSRGFTIVELMIATTVLAVLLLLASTVFLAIGNLYTKGIGGTRLQDNVRGIMQQVAGNMQFSQDAVSQNTGTYGPSNNVTEYSICLGGQRYSFAPDGLPGGSVKYTLYLDNAPDANCTPLDLTITQTSGKDLGLSNEAIHTFTIDDVTNPGLVTISLDAYAAPENSLLNLPTTADATCKGGAADQFCVTAQLTTTVARRIANP